MGLKAIGITAVLFATTLSCSAFAKHHEGPFEKIWNSAKMREGIRGKREFELKVSESDGKLFHRRDEVKLKVKSLDRHEVREEDRRDDDIDDRTCYKVEFKGHGKLFRDVKDDLEDLFDEGNELVEELHRVRIKRHSIDAVICEVADADETYDNIQKVEPVEKPNEKGAPVRKLRDENEK